MINKKQLINNAMALCEAHISMAQWETKEDCCHAMQVLAEVAFSSVAQNVGLERSIAMVAEVISKVGKAHGATVDVSVLEAGRCSTAKH